MKSVVGHSLRLIVLSVLVAADTFVLLSFPPVNPIHIYVGNDPLRVSPEQYARIATCQRLDQPPWGRFGHWFTRVLQSDLDYSIPFNAPTTSVIRERSSTLFTLLGGARPPSGILGTAMGFAAGRYLNRRPDKAICRLGCLLSSLPTFWIGMLLLVLSAVRWPVSPVYCAWDPSNSDDIATLTERLRHLALPVYALSLLELGQITLHTRESITSIMKGEFVRFTRPQGDRGWSLLRHQALRHAVTPALYLQFVSLGELLEGTPLAEKAFAYPGLGQVTTDAGSRDDLPLLIGIVLFSIVLVFIGNLLSTWLARMLSRTLERPNAL